MNTDLSGQTLASRYRVDSRIGGGGMAEVYHATDLQLGRPVAIKVALPYFANDDAFLGRFQTEARVISRLNHPNIVKLYDTGDLNGRPFLVMEFVRGKSLKAILEEAGRVPPGHALQIVDQVLAALQHAHEGGVIHRDVKPENVLLAEDGTVKLADFGIAQAGAEAHATSPGHIVGSIHYLAPERISGSPASPSSDLYSVGVLLYQMLTGRLPYEGETVAAVVAQERMESYVPLAKAAPGSPRWLDTVVRKALAPDPDGRYQSAADMRQEIRQLASGVHAGATTEMPIGTSRAAQHLGRVASRPLWLLVPAVAAMFLVALLLTGAAGRDTHSYATSTVPAILQGTPVPSPTVAPTQTPVPTAVPSRTAVPTPAPTAVTPAPTVVPVPAEPPAGPGRGGPPGQVGGNPGRGNGHKKR